MSFGFGCAAGFVLSVIPKSFLLSSSLWASDQIVEFPPSEYDISYLSNAITRHSSFLGINDSHRPFKHDISITKLLTFGNE